MDKRFNRLPLALLDAMQGLAELNGTPDTINLQVVLGVTNAAAMKRFKVNCPKIGIKPIQEYFLGIAETGMRKTTLFNAVNEGLEEYQESMEVSLRDEGVRYAVDKKKFENKLKEYQKESETDFTLKIPSPPRPIESSNYVIGKGTVNGITKPLQTQPFISLMSSEAGEFFNSHAFQGGKDISKAVEMCTALTSMWDGTPIEKNTGEESFKLKNRAVNMLFLLQARTIQSILNNSMFSEQGFIHRILITQCPSYAKPLWDSSPEAQAREQASRAKLHAFNKRIKEMMFDGVKIQQGKSFEIDFEIMNISEDAFSEFEKWYNFSVNRDTGDLKNYSGFAQRLHEHCIRLAATVAAFDKSSRVEKNHALCAIDLMEVYIEQRRSLEVGVMIKDQDRSQSAARVLEWIKSKQWQGTANELRRQGPGFFREMDVDQRTTILTDLLTDEELITVDELSSNGKTKSLFKLNPRGE